MLTDGMPAHVNEVGRVCDVAFWTTSIAHVQDGGSHAAPPQLQVHSCYGASQLQTVMCPDGGTLSAQGEEGRSHQTQAQRREEVDVQPAMSLQ